MTTRYVPGASSIEIPLRDTDEVSRGKATDYFGGLIMQRGHKNRETVQPREERALGLQGSKSKIKIIQSGLARAG